MRVPVRLSGPLADRAGRAFLRVELSGPEGATAARLREALRQAHPELAPLVSQALVVAGGRVLGPDDRVEEGEEVALLLPVAGGSGA